MLQLPVIVELGIGIIFRGPISLFCAVPLSAMFPTSNKNKERTSSCCRLLYIPVNITLFPTVVASANRRSSLEVSY